MKTLPPVRRALTAQPKLLIFGIELRNNPPDKQTCVDFQKLKKGLNHSTLLLGACQASWQGPIFQSCRLHVWRNYSIYFDLYPHNHHGAQKPL